MLAKILPWLRREAPEEAPGNTLVSFHDGRASFKDYTYRLVPRQGYGNAPLEPIARLIRPRKAAHAAWLEKIESFASSLAAIPMEQGVDPRQPFWCNDWIPGLDAGLLYVMTATRRPRHYLEIGSGNSTKFVRRAIADHGLATRITSIDPQPRAEVEELCDAVHRCGLEETDPAIFDELEPHDVVFFDGSHRCIQNSDVTVFFLEILPKLPKGVLVGIHDIFLPNDYPLAWQERMYTEQYMLAAWLLGTNDPMHVEFAGMWASAQSDFFPAIERIFSFDPQRRVQRHAGAFWIMV